MIKLLASPYEELAIKSMEILVQCAGMAVTLLTRIDADGYTDIVLL